MNSLPEKELLLGVGGSEPVTPSQFRLALEAVYDYLQSSANNWLMPRKLVPDWVSTDPFFNTSAAMLNERELVIYSERHLAHFSLTSGGWVIGQGSSNIYTGWSSVPQSQVSGYSVISRLNSTDIAFMNSGGGLSVQRYDGNAWALVGSAYLVHEHDGFVSITQLDANKVVIADSSRMGVYAFNGAIWEQVGSLYVLPVPAYKHSLVAFNSTDFARIDTSGNLSAYSFDGVNIQIKGVAYALTGLIDPVMTMLGANRIAVIDEGAKILRVFRFDGSDWIPVSDGFHLGDGIGTKLVIVAINGVDFILLDQESGKIRTYRFEFGDVGGVYRPS